jgi:outer membrane autotransporter protein
MPTTNVTLRRNFRSSLLAGASVVALALGGILIGSPAEASTYTVINTNSSGAGSLEAAITSANTAGGSNTIAFSNTLANQTITLSGALSPITSNITIDGSGASNLTISGANAYQIFQVGTAGSSTALTVAIDNVNLVNGKAVGAAGGSAGNTVGGGGAGGGGLGAGGAIAVLSGNSSVTVSNVAFNGNNATGGAGGSLGGASTTGGTGGGVNGSAGASGGSSGVAGSAGTTTGQGGGGGGGNNTSAHGGAGALGGGGGGGGGGAGYTGGGSGGTDAGGGGYGTAGSVGGGGGGGAGLGGAVFVASTSTVTFNNVSSGTTTANTVTGGAGGTANPPSATNGGGGAGAGAAVYMQSGATFSGTGTIANDIAGTGGATVNSAGNVTFTAANTYAGGTTITGNSTLNLSGSGSLLSAGAVTVNTGSTFNIATASSAETIGDLSGGGAVALGGQGLTAGTANNTTYSGVMSGTGSFTKAGSGTLTFSGSNTYSGGTTISAGTLQLGANNGAGTGPLAVTGTLNMAGFNQTTTSLSGAGTIALGSGVLTASAGSFSGAIGGTGGIAKTGAGTLNISNANNAYSGGTTVSGGTLTIAANNAAGTGPLAVASGATFSQATFNQTVAGLSGAGTVTSTGGMLTNTGSGTFTGTVTSTATLNQSGTGAQVLDGNETFASTTVSAGTLEVGDINNTSASLTSPVTVSSGGTLMGHGSITGNLTSSGGTVQPGGTIGTLTINGNYTQNASSNLAIELNPTTSSVLRVNGSASLAGMLTLMPDTGSAYPTGAYTIGKQYQILTASNGVTGTFGTVMSSDPIIVFSEIYTPTAVDVTITGFVNPGGPAILLPNTTTTTMPASVTFAEGNLTPNEANATHAIEAILPGASAGAFSQGLTAIATAPAVQGVKTALAGVLGELRADIATIDLANLTAFQNFIVERMDSRMGLGSTTQVNTGLPGTFDVAQNGTGDMPLFGGSNSLLTIDQPSVWMHGYGVLGNAGGETGFENLEYQTGGIVAGADARVTDTTLVGAALGYEHTDFHLSGDEGESNTIDTYRVTLYASQDLAAIDVPLTADGALGYAFNDYHDNDGLSTTGFGLTQTSRHTGNELTAEGGLSHGFDVSQDVVAGAFSLTPRVGIEYDNIQQNPYATTGAASPGLNLSASGSTLNALRSTLGAKADLKLTTHDGTVITPEIRASYLHDFMDTNVSLTQSFTGAPAAGFTVSGIHPGRDAALAGAGVNVGFSEALSANIGYDAAIRTHETDNTIEVGMKYKW